MATNITAQAPAPAISLPSRLFGFGSVFGKTLRDSRRAMLAVGGVLGIMLIVVSRAVTTEFGTAEAREEIGELVAAVPPIMAGLAGKAVNVETLGGYVQYKYGGFFPLVTGLWSILALSGTLAIESRRGSMEFLAATPVARRRVAVEKVLAHVVVMALAMLIVFVAIAFAGSAFATLPGDEIGVQAAFGYAAWLGLMALMAGAVAFALAPFVGRGSAVGIAGALMFAGFVLNGYREAIPELEPFADLTWFGWTTNHIPLAGVYDWLSLAVVGGLAIVLLAIGVEAFARRDLGQVSAIPTPSLPRALRGLGGPFGRSFSELIPTAFAWGIGFGIFGLVMASSAGSFIEQLGESNVFSEVIGGLWPGVDIASPGGFLQLVFVEIGLILAGLAAATLVGTWASDETSGRLEMLLATPRDRVRWAVAGGLAVLVGVALFAALTAAGIALGAGTVGGDVATPVAGTFALALYAAALAGIGLAVGGLFGARFAAPTVALVTIATWLLDFLGPNLDLPDAVAQLALSSHMGMPMVGVWDAAGVVACLVLAVGGIALGALAFARRDLRS